MIKEIITFIDRKTRSQIPIEDIEFIAQMHYLNNPSIVAFTYVGGDHKAGESDGVGDYKAVPYWCSGGKSGLISWETRGLVIKLNRAADRLKNSIMPAMENFKKQMEEFVSELAQPQVDSGLAQMYDELGVGTGPNIGMEAHWPKKEEGENGTD